MHLLSCEHPKRIFNIYLGEFVWVPCRQCNSCRNAHAAKWTQAIERERKMHRYSLFVTLTYDEKNLPKLVPYHDTFNCESWSYNLQKSDCLVSTRPDKLDLTWEDVSSLCEVKADFDYAVKRLNYDGLPYCSSYDLQTFLKRLNKWFFDNVTHEFKNFRYFFCSEYGSTTLRPHFHGILFCDDSKVFARFGEAILHTWKKGRIDCQPVEKSAGGYVAQYVNKSANLPLFYRSGKIRQRFFCSKFPTIGALSESDSSLQEIFDKSVVTQVCPSHREPTKLVDVPLCSCVENRLFPKCISFGTLSDSARITLYTINRRFKASSPDELMTKLLWYLDYSEYAVSNVAFQFLRQRLHEIRQDYDKTFNFIRRIYYISARFLRLPKLFGYSPLNFQIVFSKIVSYWSKKSLYVLRKFYQFQSSEAEKDSDSLVLMYPEFCYQNYGYNEDISKVADYLDSIDVRQQRIDSEFYSFSNTSTHFKNAYLDAKALRGDNPYIYKLLKNYFYAKKCNEACQAFATSCA